MAIEGRCKPFAVKPKVPAAGASTEAAVSAAAYGVLKALFPNRASVYQAAYEQRLAAVPDGTAKTLGVALGGEVAAEAVRLRADDGRMVAPAPDVSGTAPGQFRAPDPNPALRFLPSMKPFALDSLSPFRPAAPPPLGSAAYAAAFNETRAPGGATSAARTAEQLEAARHHSEPPPFQSSRNLGRFASSTANVHDAARLMAALYVGYTDAIAACMEAKYHDQTWRPLSAIPMAGADGNDATQQDAAWTPVLPTPPHLEYPAAHACQAGSVTEVLRSFYGTPKVTFTWDSRVTNASRTCIDIDAFNEESGVARIYGGMHFRFANAAGLELGRKVGRHVMQRHFGCQN